MNKPRFAFLSGLILAAVAARLVPHPPNFSPIAAMALFGGASFADKRAAFLVPLIGLFLSDLVLGFDLLSPIVYGSFALIVCLGFWVRRRPGVGNLAGATVLSAVLFFVVTNFGGWLIGHSSGLMYPRTLAGLTECFVAAIPFFQNTLVSDLLYATLLFGSLALAERRFVELREGRAGRAEGSGGFEPLAS